MLKAYFDTTVYSNIADGSASAKEVEDVRAALRNDKLIVYLSPANVDELLGDWEKDRTAGVRRLQVAHDLTEFKYILKQPRDLLREAIEAYAVANLVPPPTLPQDQHSTFCAVLNKIASGKADHDPVVTKISADVRSQKEEFKIDMKQRLAVMFADEQFPKLSQRQLSQKVPLDQFWGDALQWAEAFAAHWNLDAACRERGLQELFDVRAIRLCVIAAKSLVYFQAVNCRQPDLGDGYDLWHALSASAADVFVTYDKRFAQRLAVSLVCVPVDGFRVVTSLQELLALI